MRVIYLDNIRALAIITVVWIHVWDSFIIQTDFVASSHGWIIHQILHLLGRFGVPLFVMLTGALMLDRNYPKISDFLLSKIPRFIAIIFIVAFVYALLLYYLYKTPVKSVLPQIFDGQIFGAYQLWYMYMLIGLYASLPFLSRMLTMLSQREVCCLIVFSLLLVTVPWTLAHSNIKHIYQFNSFVIQTYALYAITGYWLFKYKGLENLDLRLRCFFLAILFCLTVIAKFLLDYGHPNIPITDDRITWYDSLFVYTISIILFSIIRDYPSGKKIWPIISLISKTAFSIYLWHLFIIHITVYLQYRYSINSFLMIIVTLPTSIMFGIFVYKILYHSKISWLVK